MRKMTEKLTKVCAVITAAAMIVMTGCAPASGTGSSQPTPTGQAADNTNAEGTGADDPNTAELVDNTDPAKDDTEVSIAHVVVEPYCEVVGSYYDEFENYWEYSFKLPEFTGVDTPYVQEVNADIQRIYKSYVEEALNEMNDNLSLVPVSLDYSVYENADMVSVLITGRLDYEWTDYIVYNMTAQGEKMTNADLCNMIGISEQEFSNDVESTFYNLVNIDRVSQYEWYEEMAADYQSVYEQTMEPSNISSAKAFVDEDGNLCYIGRIYSVAGSSCYDYIFHYEKHDLDSYQ